MHGTLVVKRVVACLCVAGVALVTWGCGGETDSSNDAAPATVTVVGTVSAKPSVSKPKPKPKPKPTRYGQLFVKGMTPQKASRPICRQYERVLAIATEPAETYLLQSAGALADAYAADAYTGAYDGVSREALEGRIYSVALARLKAVTRPKLTRNMLSSLGPGEVGVLEFQTFDEAADTASLGEISCY